MAASFLKKAGKIVARLLVLTFVLLPMWMWLAWRLTQKRKLVVAIVDKTVVAKEGQGHSSFDWVLNQERFTRDSTELYQRDRDYFGYFPSGNKKSIWKGLERFSEDRLKQLSDDADAVYLIGGMSSQDLYFERQMQTKHKLIIAGFNSIGSPAPDPIQNEFGESFGVRRTGWTGRYFGSLDTIHNKELPAWLVDNYMMQHDHRWPFTKSGIAFIHSDDRVVILENETDLKNEFPHILFNEEGQAHYGLPENIRYNDWFEMIRVDTTYNHIIATCRIDVNEKGQKELDSNGISIDLPAIAVHINKDYRFFYFAGDFSHNPVGLATSHFKGVGSFSRLMYNRHDPQERAGFFWKVYRPLVTRILNDYYTDVK